MSIQWTDEQLKEAGIPKRRLAALVKKLNDCSKLMRELRLEIYAVNGEGNLIHESRPDHVAIPGGDIVADLGSVVAKVGFGFNGGDW